jgi:DnaJ homolog subfamily C member 1
VGALEKAEGAIEYVLVLLGILTTITGKGTTFYSWLDIPSTASVSQISKAYRKKSIEMQ